MAISSFVMERDFDPIKSIYKDYQNIFNPQADNLINIGYCCIMTGEESTALKYFKKSLELSESWHALNNIGYILNLQGDYFQAIDYFNRALLIDTHIYSYNNRGFAKIKLGDIGAGLKDLEHSHELDPNDSYYYKNMGIYYFDINKFSKALEFFGKSKDVR